MPQTWHVTITASLSANHIGSHWTHDNTLRQNRRLALDIWTPSYGEETQCKDIELINSVSISSNLRLHEPNMSPYLPVSKRVLTDVVSDSTVWLA